MSKQASKTLIGGFVVSAVGLLAAGILVFGSGKFLEKTTTVVMYFEGSVSGLNVGAPVVFRGVKIGNVSDVLLTFDPKTVSIEIPVIVEIEPNRIKRAEEGKRLHPEESLKMLIQRGLRAQLQLQSLITGQLMIELDFHPDKPARFVGKNIKYPEVPTVPSPLQQLSETIEHLPLDELVNKLTSAVEGIDRAINSPEFGESISNFNQALKEAHKLIKDINSQIGPLSSNLESTAKSASAAVAQAEETLKSIEGVLGEDSPVIYQLSTTLEELSAAARSLRVLTDYLERHPESLLRGKDEAGGK